MNNSTHGLLYNMLYSRPWSYLFLSNNIFKLFLQYSRMPSVPCYRDAKKSYISVRCIEFYIPCLWFDTLAYSHCIFHYFWLAYFSRALIWFSFCISRFDWHDQFIFSEKCFLGTLFLIGLQHSSLYKKWSF